MLSDFLGGKRRHDALDWRPAADLYRTADGWLVKLEVAGVSPAEIEVTTEGRRVVVTGTRRDLCRGKDRRCYSLEISYTRFRRTVEVPTDLDRARIEVEYSDGMLLIHVVGAAETR